MSIGNCDCCDRTNVAGSVVNCPGEPFACYLCRGGDDDADPYGEMEIICADCDGKGCGFCSGFGTVWIEAQPVTLNDLDDLGGNHA